MDICVVDPILQILLMMRHDCTGDLNPFCRELIETIEWLRSGVGA